MDWTRQINAYCERSDLSLWSEPLNAVTNLAFLVAALVIWRRLGRTPPPYTRLLTLLLAVIGAASGAWHILAQSWAGAADTLSIAVFVLVYLYAANRQFIGLGRIGALVGTVAIVPCLAIAGWLVLMLPFTRESAPYWPVALLIAAYAAGLRRRAPQTAQRLGIGAGLLAVSILLRSLDGPLCPVLPMGTHFLWHILNALMLALMIDTLARHHRRHARLAARPARR